VNSENPEPVVFHEAAAFAAWCQRAKAGAGSLGFVPTMGALHDGHGELIRRSVRAHGATALSIFVNPRQFGRGEDFSLYPRTFESDVALARKWGASAVFVPPVEELYPQNFATGITLRPELTAFFEGSLRPGHFEGVCLVVLILLNLAQPTTVYFGQKDYQQVVIVQTLLRDIHHPARLEIVPTVRDNFGLALSSRNRYLSSVADGEERARVFVGALSRAAQVYLAGERRASGLCDQMALEVNRAQGVTLDYASCVRPFTLEPFGATDSLGAGKAAPGDADGVLVAAVRLELPGQMPSSVRLLDNLVLSTSGQWHEVLKDFVHRSSGQRSEK
jgi:pantoate--beta-alanine ligase